MNFKKGSVETHLRKVSTDSDIVNRDDFEKFNKKLAVIRDNNENMLRSLEQGPNVKRMISINNELYSEIVKIRRQLRNNIREMKDR